MMLQGSGGKTPEKQSTPSGEEVTTTGADKLEQVTEKENKEVIPKTNQAAFRPSSVVTPSRYCAIASLDEAAFDEEEQWNERTSIITKIDHELYQRYAREFLHHMADEAVALAKPAASTETE